MLMYHLRRPISNLYIGKNQEFFFIGRTTRQTDEKNLSKEVKGEERVSPAREFHSDQATLSITCTDSPGNVVLARVRQPSIVESNVGNVVDTPAAMLLATSLHSLTRSPLPS